MDCQGAQRGAKDSQEHQGTLKQLGRDPLPLVCLPGPLGLPSGYSLGHATIHQATLSYSMFKGILASRGMNWNYAPLVLLAFLLALPWAP